MFNMETGNMFDMKTRSSRNEVIEGVASTIAMIGLVVMAGCSVMKDKKQLQDRSAEEDRKLRIHKGLREIGNEERKKINEVLHAATNGLPASEHPAKFAEMLKVLSTPKN